MRVCDRCAYTGAIRFLNMNTSLKRCVPMCRAYATTTQIAVSCYVSGLTKKMFE